MVVQYTFRGGLGLRVAVRWRWIQGVWDGLFLVKVDGSLRRDLGLSDKTRESLLGYEYLLCCGRGMIECILVNCDA